MEGTAFSKIARYLSNPLVLIGFVLALLFGIHKALVGAGILKPLTQADSNIVVQLLLGYGFWLSVLVVVLGFCLAFYKAHIEATSTPALAKAEIPKPDEVGDASETSTPKRPPSVKKISPSKLPRGAELLIGREEELQKLDQAFKSNRTQIIEFVAWGGVGKSALVVDWMTRLAPDWPGINRYFDWSFYSQGTKDQSAVSSDVFIAQALSFFGDFDPKSGSPHDRGNRLAELVAQQPTVLILDGLEPLQYGTGPLKGRLKDPAVLSLLKGLAQRLFTGLCVLTTREVLTDLESFHGKTVIHHPLEHLSDTAGAALLHQSGATRRGASDIKANDKELKITSAEVKGHALTLRLLGGYLKRAHDGNIDRRDRVAFEKADALTQGGHAFRTIAAYENWLEAEVLPGGDEDPDQGPIQLSILRLLGLFDRPASPECLKALRQAPEIAQLTEQLVGLDEENWNIAVTSLEELDLVSNQNGTLDAHPLVREYFAKQLREDQKEAWTEGHRRLYEHLRETTEHHPDGIEGLQPLYQAVAHGCQAGLYQQACDDVYIDRIQRGMESDGFYSGKKLGAIGADLGAIACFFDHPWRRVSSQISAAAQSWLLNEAAIRLRALGRLTEALEPIRASLEMGIKQEAWQNASTRASNLSELELTLGQLADALDYAERSVTFADRSEDWYQRVINRAIHGDALHQAGHQDEARLLFVDAETQQAMVQRAYRRLYSTPGFKYCDLLLSGAERMAWRVCMELSVEDGADLLATDCNVETRLRQACDDVTKRTTHTLELFIQAEMDLLSIGLDHLTLARTSLYRWLIEARVAMLENGQYTSPGPCPSAVTEHVTAAVNGLRESANMHYVPQGLLTQAWSHWATNPTAAAIDLDEAWEIAERGPMPLFQTDILLTRARLFFCEDLATAKNNLAEARRLIEKHGYHRRDQELEDAEAALGVAQETGAPIVTRPKSKSSPTVVEAPVAIAVNAPNPAKDLLAQLNSLPSAWFEQLVFEFDANNAVPAATAAQSVRAMELIKVLRLTDPDFSKVNAKIDELKRGTS